MIDAFHHFDFKDRLHEGKVQWRACCTCGGWIHEWSEHYDIIDPWAPRLAYDQLRLEWLEHYDSCYD